MKIELFELKWSNRVLQDVTDESIILSTTNLNLYIKRKKDKVITEENGRITLEYYTFFKCACVYIYNGSQDVLKGS